MTNRETAHAIIASADDYAKENGMTVELWELIRDRIVAALDAKDTCRDALKPFADRADKYDFPTTKDHHWASCKVGELRNARNCLTN